MENNIYHHENNGQRFIFVNVPKDANDFCIYLESDVIADDETARDGQFVLMFERSVKDADNSADLPPDQTYTLLGRAEALSEAQRCEVIKTEIEPFKFKGKWKKLISRYDYINKEFVTFLSSEGSLQSLIKLTGFENPVLLKIEK